MTQPNDLSQVVREMLPTDRVPDDYRSVASAYRAGWNDRHSCKATPTPAEARGEDLDAECQLHREMHLQLDSIVMGAGAFEAIHDGGQREAWGNTVASVATLARQLAEAKAENERLRAMLPSPPSGQRKDFTIHEWRMAAMHYESQWGAASHHCAVIQTRAEQAEAQLAEAAARLAAVEGLIQQWRHDAQGCGRRDAHAAGTWRSCARELDAALQPKELEQ